MPFSAGKALRSTLLDTVGKAQLARFVRTLRSLESSTRRPQRRAWLTGLDLRPGATAILRTLAHVASYADLTAISADAVAAQIQLAISDGVRYLDGGWQVLVDGLQQSACRAEVRIQAPVLLVAAGDVGTRRARRRHDDQRGASVLALGVRVLRPCCTNRRAGIQSAHRRRWPASTSACAGRRPRRSCSAWASRSTSRRTHRPLTSPAGRALVHLMRYGRVQPPIDRSCGRWPTPPGSGRMM